MASEIHRYGWKFTDATDLDVELACIANGGTWKRGEKTFGLGLFEHFMNARQLAWPERYRHRWTDLIYHSILDHGVTILMGSGSSQKTSHAAEFVLLDYWAHPNNTLVLLSTTTVDKLDMAIFGEIKMLIEQARNRYPNLAGNVIDYKHAVSTQSLKGGDIRDLRCGLVGRACYQGRQWVGLGQFAGIKQERIRFVADELQFMEPTFLECLPNMYQSAGLDRNGEPNLKVIGSGNPKHDPYDQLGVAAEPEEGWESVANRTKTSTWPTKFHRGICVNLIGTDSPNFDAPEGAPIPYPRLISRNTMRPVEKRWGRDSLQFYTQCVGKMMIGMIGHRVITMEFCRLHKALDKAIWAGSPLTRIGFLDPAWGGLYADRCIWGWLEFGESITGEQIIRFGEWLLVPIIAKTQTPPDDQIGQFVKREAARHEIEPENIFYDSGGKGTIGAALARVFGERVPVPVYFGEKPSQRPVRHDLFIVDETGRRRLKRCDEEYGKFVTELWFSSRHVVESEQVRELPEEVILEGCMREYLDVRGGKYDVESKDDTRERMGKSPDLYDAWVVGVEGARQRGFKIRRLGIENEVTEKEDEWFVEEAKRYQETLKTHLLKH